MVALVLASYMSLPMAARKSVGTHCLETAAQVLVHDWWTSEDANQPEAGIGGLAGYSTSERPTQRD